MNVLIAILFKLFFHRKYQYLLYHIVESDILDIFDFVKVDGDEFRLMSVSRKYSASENDFTNEYGVEWMGG